MNKENIDNNEINEKSGTQEAEANETPENKAAEETANNADEATEATSEDSKADNSSDELSKLKDELADSKDKYLRLYSEFDNFRRRTAKEKLEMVQTAHGDLMAALLPVIDDLDRAQKTFDNEDTDLESVKEGMKLISNKLKKTLEQKGLQEMEGKQGMDFDPEIHEAITQIPAPEESLKGKVVDVIEKGYVLKEKVVRYAKVVVGS